jgi:hypothetical protein
MKLMKNTLAIAALASFALAQPAAAATRSYESLPHSGVQQAVSTDRQASVVGTAEQLRGGHPLNALIVIAVFGGLLALFAAAGLFGSGKDSTG